MNLIEKAIIFAAKAHEGQMRKSTNIPYITHPFAVGMLLQQTKCSEEVIAAGILHDTIEDTDVTYPQLVEEFSEKIANLVQAASEHDKSLPWEERKRHTIQGLSKASLEEIQVIVADKLHNLRSIREDLERDGETVWSRFNRGKKDQHWYYSSIVKALSSRKKEFKLIGQLEKEVKAVFGSIDWITNKEIDILFSCAYGIGNEEKLEKIKVLDLAKKITEKANRLYRSNQELAWGKLEDLSNRGVNFETNSDGPIILASFCIALQEEMHWTDNQLYQHFKRNISKL
ncbi:HD domain-containing protein [Lysinibacillus sp. BW-2-10]|uniref:HD domain-containing protein n=1 Tax=Lysinibacillus sp. BW-2-10 TaxID=2590030 RepID=UPI00117DA69F|nr:HD domain-containing protein [Lysinibacillus sp. BW-2-10]TSI05962.1 bifunctional (p)ppGpp synthetase/guanosine-3',5'-bis(diphosphate) 3'-pyrophosphohydrolase [Lysinibacillus sp. BW-2-10]